MITAERLKEFREKHGIRISWMRAFGFNETSVRRWESGECPQDSNLERVEKVLAMTEDEVQDALRKAKLARRAKIDINPCSGCVFFSTETKTCDYILMTRHKRPCPPGNLCTVKKVLSGSNGKPKTDRNAIIRDLYNAGKNDREIAAETGFSVGAIFKWRLRHGLKPNYNGGRPKKEGEHADR